MGADSNTDSPLAEAAGALAADPTLAAPLAAAAAAVAGATGPAKPSLESRLMEVIVDALKDPVERGRIINAIEGLGGQSRLERFVKGMALLAAGVAVITKGAVYFDGATLVVGGALATAGVAEIVPAL